MSDYIQEGAVAGLILKYVDEPVASQFGFRLEEPAKYVTNPDEYFHLSDPTPQELKEKLRNVLAALSLNGDQSVLVQYWAVTEARGPFLLATTDQPFGFYGTEKGGLDVYQKGCLLNKLYVHHDTDVHVGLPGLAFKKGTCQQTQDVHDYPEGQRPPCKDESIFSRKWGSFAVPVILADKCFGVLEFVINGPTGSCDGYIAEAHKALKKEGFQTSIQIKPSTKTFVPPTRHRETTSCKFNSYKDLVPGLGLPKVEAMKMAKKFHSLDKKIIKNTFGSAHKKAGIPYWACVSYRASYSAPKTGISQIPYIPKKTTKASRTAKTGINPTSCILKKNPKARAAKIWTNEIITELVPKDARLLEDTNEIGHQFRPDNARIPLNYLTECVNSSFGMLSASENNGFPEWPREVLMTPRLEVTGLELQDARVNQLSSKENYHPMEDTEFHGYLALIFPEDCVSNYQHNDHDEMRYQCIGDTCSQESVGTLINKTTFVTTNVATIEDENNPEPTWMSMIDFNVSE